MRAGGVQLMARRRIVHRGAVGGSLVEGFRRWARPGSTTPVARRPTRLRPPGIHRCRHAPESVVASRCTALGADRIDPDAAHFGVGSHRPPRAALAARPACSHARLPLARPGPSGERIGASRGSAPQPTGAGTLSERPAGREFGPALAERDEGSPAPAGPMPLSAARTDTDGPPHACALPEITAASTRRDSSARLASMPFMRTASIPDAVRSVGHRRRARCTPPTGSPLRWSDLSVEQTLRGL